MNDAPIRWTLALALAAGAGVVVADEIDDAIARLGAGSYAVREEAVDDLLAIGVRALPALRRARDRSADLEIAFRSRQTIFGLLDRADRWPALTAHDWIGTRGDEQWTARFSLGHDGEPRCRTTAGHSSRVVAVRTEGDLVWLGQRPHAYLPRTPVLVDLAACAAEGLAPVGVRPQDRFTAFPGADRDPIGRAEYLWLTACWIGREASRRGRFRPHPTLVLAEDLESPEPLLRSIAAAVVGLGTDDHRPILRGLLHDPDARVRREAAGSLATLAARFGAPGANEDDRARLELLAGDPDPTVRTHAAGAVEWFEILIDR